MHLPHSIPQHITPRPCRNSLAPPNHTPHAHPNTLINITTRPTRATARIRGKRATQTRAHIPSAHKCPQHTMRARTFPAATITTPELSPDTATGVLRFVSVPSPTCAALKASQPHHKPTHNTSRSPMRPSPQNTLAPARIRCTPNTISLQTTPQSHTCDPADARVSSKHIQAPPACTFHTQFHNTSHHTHACRSIAPPHHTPHAHPKTIINTTTSPTGGRHCTYVASTHHKNMCPHPRLPQAPTAHIARSYRSSCHHQNPRAQPGHRDRRVAVRGRAVSNLRSTKGVTTTSQTRPSRIALPPQPLPRKRPRTCP